MTNVIILMTLKAKNIIQPNDVPFRKLIYSDDEVQQLELLKSLLNEDNFKNTQDRLEQKINDTIAIRDARINIINNLREAGAKTTAVTSPIRAAAVASSAVVFVDASA